MGLSVVASVASHQRIACGEDWLKARGPAEEVLIIGATLGAANEIARSLARTKGASFGYHRMTLGQLASALARPVLAAQRTVPLGALPSQTARSINYPRLAGLAVMQSLRAAPASPVRSQMSSLS